MPYALWTVYVRTCINEFNEIEMTQIKNRIAPWGQQTKPTTPQTSRKTIKKLNILQITFQMRTIVLFQLTIPHSKSVN